MILITHVVYCDFCKSEPLDDGSHGHRTLKAAREEAKRFGMKRRNIGGVMKDVCAECDQVHSMQGKKARAAVDSAFRASPKALGKAAVAAARKGRAT